MKILDITDYGSIENYNLTVEAMIHRQANDAEVKKIENSIGKIIQYREDKPYKLVHPGDYFKYKDTKALLDTISSIISTRFGFPEVKLISAAGAGAAVLPMPPYTDTAINPEYRSIYDSVAFTADEDNVDVNTIRDYYKDKEKIYKKYLYGVSSLSDSMAKKPVKVDLKKAKLSGLPKGYAVMVLLDLDFLIREKELTAGEITAVLLHELGHAFTHIAYSYRLMTNTSNLLDSNKNILAGKNPRESLELMYGKVTGNKDGNSKSSTVLVVKTMDAYLDSIKYYNEDNVHAATDSEALADQFAGRFGYHQELSTGLAKLDHTATDIAGAMAVSLILPFVYVLLISLSVVYALMITALSAVLIYLLIPAVAGILFGSSDSRPTTYDGMQKRIERIKIDLIGILRENDNLSKDDNAKVVAAIEQMDKLSKSVSSTSLDALGIGEFFGSIGDLLPWNRGKAKLTKVEEILEKLQNNDAYVAMGKLKDARRA